MLQKTCRVFEVALRKLNKEIVMELMDVRSIKSFVNDLSSFTPCKDEKERSRLEHMVSYIHSCSVQHFTEDEAVKVLLAIRLAARHHKGVPRTSGEAYIMHPLEVAYGFMYSGIYDFELTIGSIIHDVPEDKPTQESRYCAEIEIEVYFGMGVKELVSSVTKGFFETKAEDWANREEHFLKLTKSQKWKDKFLKLGDRRHNLKTIDSVSPDAKQRKINETNKFFPLLCNSLIRQLNKELEEVKTTKERMQFLLVKKMVMDFQKDLNNNET